MLDAEKGSELPVLAKSGSAKVLGTPLYVESWFLFPLQTQQ